MVRVGEPLSQECISYVKQVYVKYQDEIEHILAHGGTVYQVQETRWIKDVVTGARTRV